ncbi:MAG: hypothetical protein H7177_14905 [Rhizobacter sp.]|nr:hypothetical protein [Bacteriovorax sp.]
MKLKRIGAALLLTMVAASCSSNNHHAAAPATKTASIESTNETSKAVAKTNSEYYAVLKFDKGTQRLSEASKRDLREFVASAQRDGRNIDDIKILSWADKEYPSDGKKLSDRDVKIANERNKNIEKYLKNDLKAEGSYATYNMAKRPNKITEFFKADDYKTKRIFERKGASPAGTNIDNFVTSKAGKSLIMVDYE